MIMPDAVSSKPMWQIVLAYITAIILLSGFSCLCFFMISKGLTLTESEEYKWSRMVFVFNAIQAIATASAGVLLGTNVATRVANARVADARSLAEAASKEAESNKEDAEGARAARKLLDGLEPPGGETLESLDGKELKHLQEQSVEKIRSVAKVLEPNTNL